jgi:hypothetical protein
MTTMMVRTQILPLQLGFTKLASSKYLSMEIKGSSEQI